MKELSIIIPVYKKPKSLVRLLRSAMKNTSRDLTDIILVVDDNSDVYGYNYDGNQFKVISTGIDGSGAVSAIWRGILISDTPMVGFLGDDTEIITRELDVCIINALNHSPFCVVGLNDGISEGRAHPFMLRRRWIDGYGFPPCYCHYYPDTEIYNVAKNNQSWNYLDKVKIKHHHPYAKKRGYDVKILEETVAKSREMSHNDGKTFEKRMRWWNDNKKPARIPWNIF